MFGFFKKEKRVEKIDLQAVCMRLKELYWDYETIDGKNDVVVIKGKYRNYQRDFNRLIVQFFGGKVQFKDERGRLITRIPEFVDSTDMYKEMKNILNVF